MRSAFHVTSQIDDDNRRIVFKMAGEIDSDLLIDKWIEAYSTLAEPWLYNRLFDYRRAHGLVEYEAITRFAEWWAVRVGKIIYSSKVAVIVNNPLDLARVNVVANLFPMDIRQSFESLDDALEWLGA